MRTFLLTSVLIFVGAGTLGAQSNGLSRVAIPASQSSQIVPQPCLTTDGSTPDMPQPDPKVITYISPDPYYTKSISQLFSKSNELTVICRIDEAMTARFKGNKLTTLHAVFGDEALQGSVILLDADRKVVFEQEVDPPALEGYDVWGVNYLWGHHAAVPVNYDITEKPFYIGYRMTAEEGTRFFSAITQNTIYPQACMLDYMDDSELYEWSGIPLLWADTEGEGGLKQIDARLSKVSDVRVPTNALFFNNGELHNMGMEPISSVTFSFTDSDGNPKETTIVAPEPYAYMSCISFPLEMRSASESGMADREITISKINGKDDNFTQDNALTSSIISIAPDIAPEHRVVIEELTGIWCGYCPRGIEGLAKVEKECLGRAITLAIHHSDRLSFVENAYMDLIKKSLGDPYAYVARNIGADPWFGIRSSGDFGLGELVDVVSAIPVEFDMKVQGLVDNNNGGITVQALSTPVIDIIDGARYKMVYALLEDGLTGEQTNYYTQFACEDFPNPYPYGNLLPDEMLKWYNLPYKVADFEFTHTVRAVTDIYGGDEVMAEGKITKTSQITNTHTFDADAIGDWQKSKAVAMIIDSLTGEIINGAIAPLEIDLGFNTRALPSLNYSFDGNVLTLATPADVRVYNIAGALVASADNTACLDMSSLRNSLYVINLRTGKVNISFKAAL